MRRFFITVAQSRAYPGTAWVEGCQRHDRVTRFAHRSDKVLDRFGLKPSPELALPGQEPTTCLLQLGAILTVHAAGGRAMLENAKAAAGVNTKVVAVTGLTSLDDGDLRDIGVGGRAEDQVARLADLARSAGLDGIVCSGEEVALAKKAWPDGFFVVPGVRPAGGAMGDQKRAVTPREALDRGASILVVGRPISLADNPDIAAREIEATL